MKIIAKLILIPITSVLLSLSACSDKNKTLDSSSKTETTETTNATENTNETVTEGNWKAKASELSSANAADIKSDLAELNQITNTANSQAIALQEEAKKAVQEPEELKQVMLKTQVIQQQVQQQIMALHLKSAEVQQIRVQMIDNLMTANQIQKLATASDFNLSAPSDKFKQLSQRSLALQQQIATDLNALNQQYSQP